MGKNRQTDREKRAETREKTIAGRRVKTEAVVILVIVAFVLGFFVGAVVALLRAPSPQEARQLSRLDLNKIPSSATIDLSEEIRMHEQLAQRHPKNPGAWIHLGDLLARSQQYDKAVEAYTRSLSLHPANASVLVRLGNSHFDRGAYDEAIRAYSRALTLEPANPDVLTDLGVAYRRTKKSEKALDAFRKAAKIDATHSMSRYNQGVVLFHDLEDREGAIKAWQEFLEIEPSGERAEKVRRMIENLRNMPAEQSPPGSDRRRKK